MPRRHVGVAGELDLGEPAHAAPMLQQTAEMPVYERLIGRRIEIDEEFGRYLGAAGVDKNVDTAFLMDDLIAYLRRSRGIAKIASKKRCVDAGRRHPDPCDRGRAGLRRAPVDDNRARAAGRDQFGAGKPYAAGCGGK